MRFRAEDKWFNCANPKCRKLQKRTRKDLSDKYCNGPCFRAHQKIKRKQKKKRLQEQNK